MKLEGSTVGCTQCVNLKACGGHPTAGFWGCYDYCREKCDGHHCEFTCPNNELEYSQRMLEVGGYRLDKIDSLIPARLDFPSYAPAIHARTDRDGRSSAAWVAVPLVKLFRGLGQSQIGPAATTPEYGELIRDLLRDVDRFRLTMCGPLLDEAWIRGAERHFDGPNGFRAAWDQTVHEVEAMLEEAAKEMQRGALSSEVDFLQKIGALTRATNGAGTVSAVAAVFLASRYATDPMAGLQTASQIRGLDSDTVASMCGSILAGINGATWMGSELLGLQDADYIRKIASDLSATAEVSKDWSTKPISCPQNRPPFGKSDLGEMKPNTTIELPLIGAVQVESVRILHDRKRSVGISVAVAKAFNGQTIFIYGSQKKQKAISPVAAQAVAEEAGPKVGVRFYTSNLRAIRSFYEGVLDWRPDGVTPTTVVYSNIVFADARDSGADLLLSNPSGGASLIAEVKNFELFRKRLAEKNIVAANDWFVRKSNRPNIVLQDPDGRRVEVFATRENTAK